MHEALMWSRVTIHRQNPNRTEQDEDTGRELPAWDVVAEDVPASRHPRGSRRVAVGGVSERRDTPEIDLPATQYDLADRDVIEITSGEWAGRFYSVVEAIEGDRQTVRRIPVEQVRRPSGL